MQYYEWAIGFNATTNHSLTDIRPWTFVGLKTRAGDGSVVLDDLQSVVVSVRAVNKAGGATIVTSDPVTGDASLEPTVDIPYAFGITDDVAAAVVDAAATAADPEPLVAHEVSFAGGAGGVGVGWYNVSPSDRPVSLTWEVRRFDTWGLVMEATLITPETMADVALWAETLATASDAATNATSTSNATTTVNATTASNATATTNTTTSSTLPSGFATMLETGVLQPGISYAVVIVATSLGSGLQTSYVTNRIVLAPAPPMVGTVGTDASFAEHSVTWVGFEEDVGVAWGVFQDEAAYLSHYVVCLLFEDLANATTSKQGAGGLVSSEVATVLGVELALLENGVCEDVGIVNKHRFDKTLVEEVVQAFGSGSRLVLSASVSAVSQAGLVSTVLSSGIQADITPPTIPRVEIPTQHLVFQPDFGSLTFHWTPAVVKWAPIARYYAGVARAPITSEADLPASLFAHPMSPQPFRDVGLNTSVTFNSLWLLEDVAYYAIVVADSEAGTRSVSSSAPIMLHSEAPALLSAFDVATVREPVANATTEAVTSLEEVILDGGSFASANASNGFQDDATQQAREYFEAAGVDLSAYDLADNGTDQLVADLQALFGSATVAEGLSTDEGEAIAARVDVDVDFQNATDVMSVAWTIAGDSDGSSLDAPPPSEFHITILQRQASVRDFDLPVENGTAVLEGTARNVTFTGLQLEPGSRYYANVRAVTASGVYADMITDGLVVDTVEPCFSDVALAHSDHLSATDNPGEMLESELMNLALSSTQGSSNTASSSEDLLFVSNASAITLAWAAVVDPAHEGASVAKLCPTQQELNGTFAAFDNSTLVLDTLFDGNLTGNFSDFQPGNATTELNSSSTVVTLQPAQAPLAGFAYSVDLVSSSAATANYSDVNTTLYSNDTSIWDGVAAFNGTAVNESTRFDIDYYADPVCCVPQLPALSAVLEKDTLVVESDSAAISGVVDATPHCGVLGNSMSFMPGPLLALGGLDTAVVVSMADGQSRRFRWARNMSAAYYDGSSAATNGNPEFPSGSLCVRVSSHGNAVAFAGNDVVAVYLANREQGTMQLKLQLDDRDDLVRQRFQNGSLAKAMAVSSFTSTFSGGLVTRIALSGRHLVSGEGFVMILAIDDGFETTSVDAYIQPRVQLDTPYDANFGDVLALHESCIVAWGPLTGVVLGCSLTDNGLWARVVLDAPDGSVSYVTSARMAV